MHRMPEWLELLIGIIGVAIAIGFSVWVYWRIIQGIMQFFR